MATALETVKSVLYRESLSVPAGMSFENPTDPATLQLLHILYAVCEELRRAKVWTQQKKVHTFELEANRSRYPLPKDFYAPLPMTHYDRSDRWTMRLLSDSSFAYQLYSVTSGSRKSYRLFGPDFNPNTTVGGQFWIDPADSVAGRDITFEYVSKNLFLPKHWAPSTDYTSGMYVNMSAEIYLCDTNGTSSTTGPAGQTSNQTDGTTRWDWVSDPYETIIDDNDINLFDDDLVKLGLRAKFFEGKGEEFETARTEFQDAISAAVSRYKGSFVGSMTPQYEGPNYRLPPGSWST